jgi:hypothetical protein
MQHIASSQYDALGHAYGQRFIAQACDSLRAKHAEHLADTPEDALRQFVRRGVERARGHGLLVERDMLRFIDCQLRFGAEFDRDPAYTWAQRILAMPLGGTHRMNTLQTYEREFLASTAARPATGKS